VVFDHADEADDGVALHRDPIVRVRDVDVPELRQLLLERLLAEKGVADTGRLEPDVEERRGVAGAARRTCIVPNLRLLDPQLRRFRHEAAQASGRLSRDGVQRVDEPRRRTSSSEWTNPGAAVAEAANLRRSLLVMRSLRDVGSPGTARRGACA
jgi:hypothetical protein